MKYFEEPICEIVRFASDVIVTSTCAADCACDFGGFSFGDDDICTNPVIGGDLAECQSTQDAGNC